MSVIRRVSPSSAFKVGAVVYAIVGLAVGIVVELIALSGIPLPGTTQVSPGFPFGPGAMLFFPFIYALIGGIFGALGAVVYNLASMWVGGLQVDIN